MLLKNKVCIITGATRGIGFEIAQCFLKQGAYVCLCGSRDESVNNALEKLQQSDIAADKYCGMVLNLEDEAMIYQAFLSIYEKWGKIDVLVNNAGISTNSSIEDTSLASYMHELSINLGGVFACIKHIIPFMKKHGGSIINTSSLVSRYGSVNQAAYVSSKFGVNGLTIAASRELGKYNIRVNAVAPGVIATDMVKNMVDAKMQQYLEDLTPLKRIGQPAELCGAYLYLASDNASFTTGSIIDVNGGIIK